MVLCCRLFVAVLCLLLEKFNFFSELLNGFFLLSKSVLKMQYLALVIYFGVKPVGGWIASAASLYQVVSIKEVLKLADGNFCHFLEGAATFANFWE